MSGGLDAQLMLTYGLVFQSCSILQHIPAALLLSFLPFVFFYSKLCQKMCSTVPVIPVCVCALGLFLSYHNNQSFFVFLNWENTSSFTNMVFISDPLSVQRFHLIPALSDYICCNAGNISQLHNLSLSYHSGMTSRDERNTVWVLMKCGGGRIIIAVCRQSLASSVER